MAEFVERFPERLGECFPSSPVYAITGNVLASKTATNNTDKKQRERERERERQRDRESRGVTKNSKETP